jgi:hypothetical protein
MATTNVDAQLADTGNAALPKQKRNLLEIWKQEADWLSSEYRIQQPAPLTRKGVNALYKVFKKHLPDSFFETDQYYNDDNWIHCLLIQPGHIGSVKALMDIGQILFYYEGMCQREPHLEVKFKSLLGDPEQLRNFFFELYTYRLLLLNNLSIEVNPIVEGQVLEGNCMIDGKLYMFECKQLFIPFLSTLHNQVYTVGKLHTDMAKVQLNNGMIGTFKFNNPYKTNIKGAFDNWLNKFIAWNNKPKEPAPLHFKDVTNDGTFEVTGFYPDRRIELLNDQKLADIWFSAIPPFIVTPGMQNHYRIELQMHFQVSQSTIQHKLQESLRKKRRQHKNRTQRIFFVDSEAINGLSMAIFHSPGMFDQQQIQKHFDEHFKEDDILVFILRNYTVENGGTKIKVFAHQKNDHIKKKIESFKVS